MSKLVRVKKFQMAGVDLIDIRLCEKDGKPTRRGISIQTEQLEELIEVMRNLDGHEVYLSKNPS